MKKIHSIFNRHFEWVTLLTGVSLLAFMNPYSNFGISLCLFENLGIYCPGDGLGHAIAFIFRGMWLEAWQSNPIGYPALIILSSRVTYLMYNRIKFTHPI